MALFCVNMIPFRARLSISDQIARMSLTWNSQQPYIWTLFFLGNWSLTVTRPFVRRLFASENTAESYRQHIMAPNWQQSCLISSSRPLGGPWLLVAENLIPRDIMSFEPRHWMEFGHLVLAVQCCADELARCHAMPWLR